MTKIGSFSIPFEMVCRVKDRIKCQYMLMYTIWQTKKAV